MVATKLILHHRYTGGIGFDFSDHGNHGVVRGAHLQSGGANAGTLRFDGGSDRVDVARRDSTDRMREFHVRVRFFCELNPGDPPQRMNLVEGESSFALFVESTWRIGATTRWVDTGPGPTSSTGWDGIFTPYGSVTPNRWHTVDYRFDGIGHSQVVLDGSVIGERWNHPAPIQPLAARGITIGHWPGDDRYTLKGHLGEVKIWREEPERDPGGNLEDCCIDRGWVDDRVAEARRAGWDLERTLATIDDLSGALRDAASAVRGGDRARTLRLQASTRDAMSAMGLGNRAGFVAALGAIRTEIDSTLDATARAHHTARILDAFLASPAGHWVRKEDPEGSRAFLAGALDAACLGDMAPPPKDRHPKEPDAPQPSGGDPDTDDGLPPWAEGQPGKPPPWTGEEPKEPRDPKPPKDPLDDDPKGGRPNRPRRPRTIDVPRRDLDPDPDRKTDPEKGPTR